MPTNPFKSLSHAKLATSLGDIPSTVIHATILDNDLLKNAEQFTTNRLQLSSQLMAKLDPCFSFNAQDSKDLTNLSFIKLITGDYKLFCYLFGFFRQTKK